jgi:large subunit ribosomal protein L18
MSRTERRIIRHNRIRKRVFGKQDRPRLSVYKSLNYIYAQIIDDEKGITLVSASTNEPSFRRDKKSLKNKNAAKLLGRVVAERAKEKSIKKVVFDRGGFKYHGVIKEFAEIVRNGGLEF